MFTSCDDLNLGLGTINEAIQTDSPAHVFSTTSDSSFSGDGFKALLEKGAVDVNIDMSFSLSNTTKMELFKATLKASKNSMAFSQKPMA